MQGTGGEVIAGMGHNKPPLSKAELELAFRERTRADRITDSTPFDLKWQWEVWLSDLPSSAMLVAFAIRIYANQDGTKSHPSLDTLAMMTKLSRRHVQDSLKLIEKQLVRKTAGAGRAANRYTLIIPSETLQELATVIDIRSRAPRASQDDGSRAPDASQADFVAGHPVPHKPVVGQMEDRSRARGALDITRDITENKQASLREGSIGKAAAVLAAGIAVAVVPVAAAAHPIEHVRAGPAGESGGTNAATEMIIAKVAKWIDPWRPDYQTARNWLGSTITMFSESVVRAAFVDMETKMASGEVIPKPLKLFTKICQGKQENQTTQRDDPTAKYRKFYDGVL